jgi:hypothetical protein
VQRLELNSEKKENEETKSSFKKSIQNLIHLQVTASKETKQKDSLMSRLLWTCMNSTHPQQKQLFTATHSSMESACDASSDASEGWYTRQMVTAEFLGAGTKYPVALLWWLTRLSKLSPLSPLRLLLLTTMMTTTMTTTMTVTIKKSV